MNGIEKEKLLNEKRGISFFLLQVKRRKGFVVKIG
jgi:hypothetical protein